jgi:hypothetical protein
MEKSRDEVPDTGASGTVTDSESRRAIYLATYLKTHSRQEARKASGLSRHAHGRILKMLETQRSISDAPRSGRPSLYSKAVMDKAVQILVENEEQLLTGHMLLDIMISLGQLPMTADIDTFMHHLRDHVISIGHKLVVNSTRTIFMLTATDVITRLQFAANMLAELEHGHSRMLIFIDETTLEEAPHPKGKFNSGEGGCGSAYNPFLLNICCGTF